MTERSRRPSRARLNFSSPSTTPVDLDYWIEDWIAFAVFWALAVVVFLQFFTRYVLNNSLGWTEEIARYLLIAVTFIGAAMAMRKRSHIAVEAATATAAPRRATVALAVDLDLPAFFGFAPGSAGPPSSAAAPSSR